MTLTMNPSGLLYTEFSHFYSLKRLPRTARRGFPHSFLRQRYAHQMSSLPSGGDCMEYEMRDGAWAPVVSEELSQHFPFTQHLFTPCFIFASLDKIPLVLARSLLRCLARFRFYICPFASTIILVVLWRHFLDTLFEHSLAGFLFIQDSSPFYFYT